MTMRRLGTRRAHPTRSGSAPARTPIKACADPPTDGSGNELVQLTFGDIWGIAATCAAFAIGRMPDRALT